MTDDLNPIDRLAATVDRAVALVEGTRASVDAMAERTASMEAAIAALEQRAAPPPPAARMTDPGDRMVDPYTRFGYTPGDFELAGFLFDGARRLSNRPIELTMPEDFRNAWRHFMFERPDPIRVVTEQLGPDSTRGPRTSAMDTAESGFGQELVGAQYASELWEAARNLDSLLPAIPSIVMKAGQERGHGERGEKRGQRAGGAGARQGGGVR